MVKYEEEDNNIHICHVIVKNIGINCVTIQNIITTPSHFIINANHFQVGRIPMIKTCVGSFGKVEVCNAGSVEAVN